MLEDDRAGETSGAPRCTGIRTKGLLVVALRASAIIGVSLLLTLAVYSGYVGGPLIRVFAEWMADWTSEALNLLGASTRAHGTILSTDGFAANVVIECTAVGPLLLFAGAVLAYPSTLKAKSAGLLMGIAILVVINLVRVASLFWIGSNFPQYLSVAHLLVWQSATVLLAIVIWFFWVERVVAVGDA